MTFVVAGHKCFLQFMNVCNVSVFPHTTEEPQGLLGWSSFFPCSRSTTCGIHIYIKYGGFPTGIYCHGEYTADYDCAPTNTCTRSLHTRSSVGGQQQPETGLSISSSTQKYWNRHLSTMEWTWVSYLQQPCELLGGSTCIVFYLHVLSSNSASCLQL